MDVRYTGHYYQFAEKTAEWAKKQPRKGLWERNLRFYIPKFHGDFATTFTDFVQKKYERLSKKGVVESDSSIWGPNPPRGQATTPFDDLPPLNTLTPVNDNFTWGVEEEADLLTFLPMFNPDTTHYVLRNIFYNYPKVLNPAGPPRRATIITFYRISHRLLSTMHLENIRDPGHHMTSEIWPQATALHHGFKAVYVPHSIYHERKWPAKALDFIFNNGDSPRIINEFKDVSIVGEGSGGWESVFGLDREHNFWDSSWYYRSSLSATLYKRLLGYEVEGIGGKRVSCKLPTSSPYYTHSWYAILTFGSSGRKIMGGTVCLPSSSIPSKIWKTLTSLLRKRNLHRRLKISDSLRRKFKRQKTS